MKNLKSFYSKNKDLVKLLMGLVFLLIIFSIFLIVFGKLNNSESFNIVLGISLGTFAGFFADNFKRNLDHYQEVKIFKKTVIKLLEQDAKNIFRIFDMWSKIRNTSNNKNSPPGIENMLPPKLEMKYWNKLSQKDEFLLLAEDEKLESIFRKFWDFERLSNLINEATDGDRDDQKVKQSYALGLFISQETIKNNSHEKFLSLFLTVEEVEGFKKTMYEESR